MPFNEVAGGEVKELGFVELGVEGKIEPLERLRRVERGAAEAKAERVLGAPLDLVLQQQGQEVHEGRLLLRTSKVSKIPDRRRVRSMGVN